MKKFIIKVTGDIVGTKYVVNGTDLYCELSPEVKDAKMFDSVNAAKEFMSKYAVNEDTVVEYKEIICLDLLNKEDK